LSEKSLVDEIRELRKVFDEINALKNELNALKNSLANIKPIDENKIREVTEKSLEKIFGGIEEEIKNQITPEWLEKHLETCKDLDCKWCGVVLKYAKKLMGEGK
jgi:hypothetical protein